jgi:C-terminal processing protease CtpA/Prc
MKAIAVLLTFAAIAPEARAQDDLADRIRRRLETELAASFERTRIAVREIVFKELNAAGVGGLAGEISRFARELVVDDVHGRLARLLGRPEGQDLVEQFMSEQNLDAFSELVENYFERTERREYRVREEFAELLGQVLETVEPAPVGTLVPSLGIRTVEDARGARIAEVLDGGVAAKAGLRKDDVIAEAGGKQLTAANVNDVLTGLPPKSDIALVYYRAGAKATATIKLEERERRSR